MFFNDVKIDPVLNKKWEQLVSSRCLTVPQKKLFCAKDSFFTIGSCFAEEIRKALVESGVSCLPRYRDIYFDRSRSMVDTLPHREHMNYYNAFSIAQEFARAAGRLAQGHDDYWSISGRQIVDGRMITSVSPSDVVYQDPYKRLVFADSPELLTQIRESITSVFLDGLRAATVAVITLGMTEVFRSKKTNLVVNQVPVYGGGAGLRETAFDNTTFDENLAATRAALLDLRSINPDIQVVLTVSPVPLHRSFGVNDIFVNNYASKCTLRAVVEQICREFDWVHYFPSFEIVWNIGSPAYEQRDLLHVKPEVVKRIVKVFMESFFNDLSVSEA